MPGNTSWYILVNFIILRLIDYALFIWNHTTLPLVEQELVTLPEYLNSLPVFSRVCVARSLVFSVVFCSSFFVPISFFFWPLYCLSFFDLRFLITPLLSLSSSNLVTLLLW